MPLNQFKTLEIGFENGLKCARFLNSVDFFIHVCGTPNRLKRFQARLQIHKTIYFQESPFSLCI